MDARSTWYLVFAAAKTPSVSTPDVPFHESSYLYRETQGGWGDWCMGGQGRVRESGRAIAQREKNRCESRQKQSSMKPLGRGRLAVQNPTAMQDDIWAAIPGHCCGYADLSTNIAGLALTRHARERLPLGKV